MIARHNSNCTSEDMKAFVGKLGDKMVICKTCKRVTRAERDVQVPDISAEAKPSMHDGAALSNPIGASGAEPGVTRFCTSRYVCPLHATPVDSRGRGCGECRSDRDALAVTRRHRRAERRHGAVLRARQR